MQVNKFIFSQLFTLFSKRYTVKIQATFTRLKNFKSLKRLSF